jgi:nitrogen regulatory protein PII
MKRLEMVVETSAVPAVVAVLGKHATGYTIVPNVSGFGEHGAREDDIVLLVTVTTTDHVDPILDAIMPLLSARSGIVMITDVTVLRAEHFIPEVRAALTRST